VRLGSAAVVDAPMNCRPFPRTSFFSAIRCVLAAVVETHGLGWSRVDAPGPELPADTAL
jgi:hypothetical protein